MPNEEESKPVQLEVMQPSALETIERAQIDMQISTARKYPRELSVVLTRVKNMALVDEETAGSCFYTLVRRGKEGKKNIEGPSIRFAEICASAFGNMRYGSRVIGNDGKTVTAQGYCHDLESNLMHAGEVKRRITDSSGRTYSDDMIVVTGNAACAIAMRNSVFKVIPQALVKSILMEAKRAAVGDAKTLVERRTKMVEALSKLGVNEKRICAAVDKAGLDDIGLDELATILGLFNAIKEEQTTVEEAFPEPKKPVQLGQAIPDGDAKAEPSAPATTPTQPPDGEKEKKAATKTKPKKEEEKPPAPPTATPVQGLRNLMATSNIEEKDLLTHLFATNFVGQGDKLDTLPEGKIAQIVVNWVNIVNDIRGE